MIEFRDRSCAEHGFKLIVHVNEKALASGMNPFDYPSSVYTPTMNTHALIDALDTYRFDAALGGGRRDANHHWNPKSQRPELWDLYNTRIHRGENIRVFPLSNWTELDIWQSIHREKIPLVPLSFAAERPVAEREGLLIMVDDGRHGAGDHRGDAAHDHERAAGPADRQGRGRLDGEEEARGLFLRDYPHPLALDPETARDMAAAEAAGTTSKPMAIQLP